MIISFIIQTPRKTCALVAFLLELFVLLVPVGSCFVQHLPLQSYLLVSYNNNIISAGSILHTDVVPKQLTDNTALHSTAQHSTGDGTQPSKDTESNPALPKADLINTEHDPVFGASYDVRTNNQCVLPYKWKRVYFLGTRINLASAQLLYVFPLAPPE